MLFKTAFSVLGAKSVILRPLSFHGVPTPNLPVAFISGLFRPSPLCAFMFPPIQMTSSLSIGINISSTVFQNSSFMIIVHPIRDA